VKRIGLIGGVSPESTEVYVRLLNQGARMRLGGEHSANFLVFHLDYGVMIGHYRTRNWPAFIDEVVKAGAALTRAGADALMIGSNTTHIAAGKLAETAGVRVIHLLDALADAMRPAGVRRPLLIGTAFTMSGDFYRSALAERYKGEVSTPTEEEQRSIERIILDELCHGVVKEDSRQALLDVIGEHGEADGVILGCTELSLILGAGDVSLPVFDTTRIHAAAASAFQFS